MKAGWNMVVHCFLGKDDGFDVLRIDWSASRRGNISPIVVDTDAESLANLP
jgi:hypothetical protein